MIHNKQTVKSKLKTSIQEVWSDRKNMYYKKITTAIWKLLQNSPSQIHIKSQKNKQQSSSPAS